MRAFHRDNRASLWINLLVLVPWDGCIPMDGTALHHPHLHVYGERGGCMVRQCGCSVIYGMGEMLFGERDLWDRVWQRCFRGISMFFMLPRQECGSPLWLMAMNRRHLLNSYVLVEKDGSFLKGLLNLYFFLLSIPISWAVLWFYNAERKGTVSGWGRSVILVFGGAVLCNNKDVFIVFMYMSIWLYSMEKSENKIL